ncbi:hypothetical protein KF7HA_02624 [Lactococcus lactis]|nr:hypothetical protein [Lactococcus lactis]
MKKLIKKAAIGMVAFFVVAASGPVFAAVGDQGVDWSKYNGDYGNFGYDHDKLRLLKLAELMAVHSWTKPLIQHKLPLPLLKVNERTLIFGTKLEVPKQ